MKYIDNEKFNVIIAADFDALCEITGEFGDESWDDQDIEMLMEKHALTGREANELLTELANILNDINLAVVKGADKGAIEVLSHFNQLDDGHKSAMWTQVWHGISEGIRESLVECLKRDPTIFVAAMKEG